MYSMSSSLILHLSLAILLLLMVLDYAGGYFSKRLTNKLNLYGEPIEPCSVDGSGEAGFPGGSSCIHYPMDKEGHNICINVPTVTGGENHYCELTKTSVLTEDGQQPPEAFCNSMQRRCTNDRFGRICNITHYCVSEISFADFVEKAGCESVGHIYCESTNMMAILDYEELISVNEDLKAAGALDCIKEKCKML